MTIAQIAAARSWLLNPADACLHTHMQLRFDFVSRCTVSAFFTQTRLYCGSWHIQRSMHRVLRSCAAWLETATQVSARQEESHQHFVTGLPSH